MNRLRASAFAALLSSGTPACGGKLVVSVTEWTAADAGTTETRTATDAGRPGDGPRIDEASAVEVDASIEAAPDDTVDAQPDGDSPATPRDSAGDTAEGVATDVRSEADQPDARPVFSFRPSHVLSPFASIPEERRLAGVTFIDTSTLTIQTGGAVESCPTADAGAPPGTAGSAIPSDLASFSVDAGGNAVLSVGTWLVDAPVRICGARGLIVVASGSVLVNDLLQAGAQRIIPGPGGGWLGGDRGPGAGNGPLPARVPAGGGGASFGSPGGTGGSGQWPPLGESTAVVPGGAPGATYGATLADFVAGSSGGGASPGAGGGALQISAAISIVISGSGSIDVGGGGGGSSSGGGSGGTMVLESPSIACDGWLAANGGGGGEGGLTFSPSSDGLVSTSPAPGGRARQLVRGPPAVSGYGGAGAARSGDALPGGNATAPTTGVAAAGGGGGGYGRIWIRTRTTAPALSDATVSPEPSYDLSL